MSWTKKYEIAYYRLSGGVTTIDILEKDYGGGYTTFKGTSNPLEIEWEGSFENIYIPTCGSGATISFITPVLTMLDMFTDDPQKYIVKIWNGESGSTLRWQGFVNLEIYNESYDNPLFSQLSLQCNDGMVVLENLAYKEDDGDYYTGTVTIAEIFTNIFAKLGISFTSVLMNHEYQVNEYVTNLFLNLKLPNENFIDESGEVMSCREVLDSIVGGFGFSMFFIADTIYILDPHMLHFPSKGKTYNPAFSTESQQDVGGFLDISTEDITWKSTGQALDIFPARAQIIVDYDPFTREQLLFDFSDTNNWDDEGSWIGGASEVNYNTGVVFTGWDIDPDLNTSLGIKESRYATEDYMVVLRYTAPWDWMSYTFPRSNITQDDHIMMRISMDVYAQTKEDSMNIFSELSGVTTYGMNMTIAVQVGDKYYKGAGGWYTGWDSNCNITVPVIESGISIYEYTKDNASSIINDKWITVSVIIPMFQELDPDNPAIGGDVKVFIYGRWGDIKPTSSQTKVRYVMVKNLKVDFIDAGTLLFGAGKPITNEGIRHKGYESTNLLGRSELNIKTTTGCGPCGLSRGALISLPQPHPNTLIKGLFLGDWIDSATAISSEAYEWDTADLILRGAVAQYKSSRYILTGILDAQTYALELRTKLIQDTNYVGTRAFFVCGGKYVDREETIDIKMIELTDTKETIV